MSCGHWSHVNLKRNCATPSPPQSASQGRMRKADACVGHRKLVNDARQGVSTSAPADWWPVMCDSVSTCGWEKEHLFPNLKQQREEVGC